MKASVYSKPLVSSGYAVPYVGPIVGHKTKDLIIDYLIAIEFDLCSQSGRIQGNHDGYPSYTIRIGGAGVVYDFHQKSGFAGPGVAYLLPPMDVYVEKNFTW